MTIDVIIPAYNAAATLPRALASVAMQSVAEDVCVTVVDDGSDRPYDTLLEPWRALLRLRLLRLEENAGPGAARQAGLDAAEGEAVCFLDADDSFFSALALERLRTELVKTGADVAYGAFYEQLADGALVRHEQNMTWLFGKLYRRSFLRHFDLRFNATRANEDMGFNGVVAGLSRAIRYIPEPVYLWHFRADSITRAEQGSYAAKAGFQGFVDNLVWQFCELARRGLSVESLRREAAVGMAGLYFTLLDALCRGGEQPESESTLPDRLGALLSTAQDYYRRVYSIFDGHDARALDAAYLLVRRGYAELLNQFVPPLGFQEFIRALRGADYGREQHEPF